jgi:hypothetical protein
MNSVIIGFHQELNFRIFFVVCPYLNDLNSSFFVFFINWLLINLFILRAFGSFKM